MPPLARAAGWATVELDLGDGPQTYRRELNTMPQWAGSCWYYLRYLDPDNEQAFVAAEVERYWMVPPDAPPGDGGVDLYVGGVEHAVLHLLYARFWHKVLFDLGYVSTREPFRRLFNQGYILADAFTDERGRYVPAAEVSACGDGTPATGRGRDPPGRGEDGQEPEEQRRPRRDVRPVRRGHAAAVRDGDGPAGQPTGPGSTSDVTGVHRFLQRLWRSMMDEQTGDLSVGDRAPDEDTLRRLHQTIRWSAGTSAALRFNTAHRPADGADLPRGAGSRRHGGALPRALAEPLVLMVAPLAPHIAEELWARLGHEGSLAYAALPEADPALAAEQAVSLPVQINGRTRFAMQVPAGAGREQIAAILAGDPDVARHLGGAAVNRLVIVPGRIVNVVTRPTS